MEIPYSPPPWLFNTHLQTIYPAFFRKVEFIAPEEIVIETPDNDFLEIDYYSKKSRKLVVICHGLEGNSRRPYMLGMAKMMYENEVDVVAWNYRGCGSQMNRQDRFYHSGATDDLSVVIDHFLEMKIYDEVFLIGFSLGGNLILKYLGEREVDKKISKSMAISVPIDLHGGSDLLGKYYNRLYAQRFLTNLKEKVVTKAKIRGDKLPNLEKIKTLREFDDFMTAPIHGFKNAEDYYAKCNSRQYLEHISTQTVILNAKNDTFLSENCFKKNNQNNSIIWWEPEAGGHVGFTGRNGVFPYFSEQCAKEFFINKE